MEKNRIFIRKISQKNCNILFQMDSKLLLRGSWRNSRRNAKWKMLSQNLIIVEEIILFVHFFQVLRSGFRVFGNVFFSLIQDVFMYVAFSLRIFDIIFSYLRLSKICWPTITWELGFVIVVWAERNNLIVFMIILI